MGKLNSGVRVEGAVGDAWRAKEGDYFITARFDPAVRDAVVLRDVGVGGFLAALPTLPEDEVTFVAAPFFVEGRERSFFFTYVGAGVPAMRKGKVSVQKSAVFNVFEGAHAELYVTDADDAQPPQVIAKLSKMLGVPDSAISLTRP
jgi:hypothetical protein